MIRASSKSFVFLERRQLRVSGRRWSRTYFIRVAVAMGSFIGKSCGKNALIEYYEYKLDFRQFTEFILTQTLQQDEMIGAAFHPLDDNLMITYGKGHLTFWTRRKDGFFERTDIIKPVSLA